MPNATHARTRPENPSTAFNRVLPVVLLSLPAIVGTAFFLTGVIVSATYGPGVAPADPFREQTGAEDLKMALGFGLFLTCYFGAAYGPLLLLLAGWQAFAVTRALGARSTAAIWAWTFVVLGVTATALFWGWLIDLDIFV